MTYFAAGNAPNRWHSYVFKMANKIARKKGHWQMFVEYHNSKNASFLSDEDLIEIAFATIQSPENKLFIDQLVLNYCIGSAVTLALNNFQPYFYSVLEINSSISQ